MKPIYETGIIHIDVTNACNMTCSNCSRFVGHHTKTFLMDLETVEKALKSLKGFPGKVGLMGGEPTIHPDFYEICKLYQKYIPDKNKRGLWTNGMNWDKYEDIIKETFFYKDIVYNDHTEPEAVHQSLLVAAKDVVEDEKYMWELIDNCWIQDRWSASITPKGAFFCEVAAAQDYLFDGPGGYDLEEGWWNKEVSEFQDQVKDFCGNCGAAVPMPRIKSQENYEFVSSSVQEKLSKASNTRVASGKKIELFTHVFSKEEIENEISKGWTPWSHRPFKQVGPNKFLDKDGNVVDRKIIVTAYE